MNPRIRTRPTITLIGFMLASAILSSSFARSVVFGPETYTRTTRRPAPVTKTFEIQRPSGFYVLRVVNRGVTSAVIEVNDRTILGPKDFTMKRGKPWRDHEWDSHASSFNEHWMFDARDNRQDHRDEAAVPFLARPIRLRAGTNSVVVEHRGAPGTSLTLEIVAFAASDSVPPTITPQIDPPPNADGWNNSPVTVSFTCTDAGSGIASCPAPVVVDADGSNQAISGTATDQSGNTATADALVSLDRVAPTATFEAPAQDYGAVGDLRVAAVVQFADQLSGIGGSGMFLLLDGTDVSNGLVLDGGRATFHPSSDLSEGTHVYAVWLKDRAGNVSNKQEVRFHVAHEADGFGIVDNAGGRVTLTQGPLAGSFVDVPAGAVSSPTPIWMDAVTDPLDPDNPEQVLELRPHGVQFNVPVTVGLPSAGLDSGESLQHLGFGETEWGGIESFKCGNDQLCGSLTSFSYLQRFVPWICQGLVSTKYRSGCIQITSSRPPLLLVHGFIPEKSLKVCTAGSPDLNYFTAMPLLLSAAGFDVWQYYYDTCNGIMANGRDLASKIKYVSSLTGKDVVVVGHSMGGLVARQALQDGDLINGPAGHVRRLITIGTPHRGTALAEFPGLFGAQSGKDMSPGSLFLMSLDLQPQRRLTGPYPQYVFLSSRTRAIVPDPITLSPKCGGALLTLTGDGIDETDGVVPLMSQRLLLSSFDAARPEPKDWYPHANRFVDPIGCNNSDQMNVTQFNAAGHQVYQDILSFALGAIPGIDIDHLAPPTIYDNARDGFGQTFTAVGTEVRGIELYLDDPTRPFDASVNELVGPADLVLYDIANPAVPIEIHRTRIAETGNELSGLTTMWFDVPVSTVVGTKYFIAIRTTDGFGVGLRQQFSSTYADGAQAYFNCIANAPCDQTQPTGKVVEDPNGRDMSFKIKGG